MGFVSFMYRQAMVHPQPIPFHNLSGKTVLITGANVGIGLEATRLLMSFEVARIIMAVRNPSKGAEAKAILQNTNPDGQIEVWELDMDSFPSIMAFGKRAQEQLDRLDIVLLNAGVKKTEYTKNKATGHESTVQVNHLATALLSLLLLPPLQSTATKTGTPSRMTFTSSEVHMWTPFKEKSAPHILYKLDDPSTFGAPERYNVSKLLNVLWAREMASKVKPSSVVINAVNPGLVASSLHRDTKSSAEKKFVKLFGRSTEEGGLTIVNAAIVQGPSSHGGYLSECKMIP